MKRNTAIGLALAIVLCGVSPIQAEPLERMATKGEKPESTAGARAQAPSAVRQLLDFFLLRRQVRPAGITPVRKNPFPVVPSNEEFDLPTCDQVPDPSVPCRNQSPVGG